MTQVSSIGALLRADVAVGRLDQLLTRAVVACGGRSDRTATLVGHAALFGLILAARRTLQTPVTVPGLSRLDVLACLQAALREAHAIDDTLLDLYPEVTSLRVLLDEAHHCLRTDPR